jgi:protein-L-isoaspartate(D-aspartate) O-methyltransferase
MQAERNTMVRTQIAARGINDRRVLEAMRSVPRHLLIPKKQRRFAHADRPLPIGYGQTISQPYIVALMTELLELNPGEKVLEIGTGSGYQAAVLTELTPHVYTIEILKPLAESAAKTLRSLGYTTVTVKQGDGYYGCPEHGPYDAIIVTCAAGHLPPPLFKQLKPGGRIVIPMGDPGSYQELQVVTRDPKTGLPRHRSVCGVAFVPMTGQVQRRAR